MISVLSHVVRISNLIVCDLLLSGRQAAREERARQEVAIQVPGPV
jgi:hypothetical protein